MPIEGLAADRDLVPEYPGITGSESLADWDPPFPVDLARVRDRDEEYWDQYRTTPKAFITLARRAGALARRASAALTSLRLLPRTDAPAEAALEAVPLKRCAPRSTRRAAAWPSTPARAEGLEGRARRDRLRRVLSLLQFLPRRLGAAADRALLQARRRAAPARARHPARRRLSRRARSARSSSPKESCWRRWGARSDCRARLLYGKLMMLGLRRGGWARSGRRCSSCTFRRSRSCSAARAGCWPRSAASSGRLRRLAPASPRSLLDGRPRWTEPARRKTSARRAVHVCRGASSRAVGRAGHCCSRRRSGLVGQVAGFFGGGALLLVALLCFQSVWLRRRRRRLLGGGGWWAVARLGFRNATHRPGRSVLCIALIASASFIIVAVDAFRRDGAATRRSTESPAAAATRCWRSRSCRSSTTRTRRKGAKR